VDDALRVSERDGPRDVADDRQDLERDHPTAEQERVEGAAVQELHHQERRAVLGAAEIEDVDDAGWRIEPQTLASLKKRASAVGSRAMTSGRITLIATSRAIALVLCSPNGPHAAVPDEAKQSIP